MSIFSQANLQAAYRKFKSMAYYDTYGALNRDKIAEFEAKNHLHENDQYFERLSLKLSDKNNREIIFEKTLKKIRAYCYPKKMLEIERGKEGVVVSNSTIENCNVKNLQYHIDLDVVGNILGVLWVIEFGAYLDGMLIDNCFGNRMKPYLRKEEEHSVSPFLFEPYFKKYESWRDGALNVVQQYLDTKQDVIVISLDIKSYYYFARIDFEEIRNALKTKIDDEKNEECNILTNFIEKVFKEYSALFTFDNEKDVIAEKPLLPVGFAPSMVIANWYLNEFDRKVQRELHPIYYGRYVDDFLVVLPYYPNKEKGSFMLVTDVINTYFTASEQFPKYDFFISPQDDVTGNYYFAQEQYSRLSVQMDKFKVYVFNCEEAQTLINKFRREIQQNSSEFRYMFEKNNISKHIEDEIYNIEYDGSITKIRSINGIGIDKFKLSKTLSKLIYASMENGYNDRPQIFAELVRSFKDGSGLELFTLWEKVLTLLFIQERYKEMEELINHFIDLIKKANFKKEASDSSFQLTNKNDKQVLKRTVKKSLIFSLWRVLALRKKKRIVELEGYVENKAKNVSPGFLMKFDTFRNKYLTSQLINSKITMVPIRSYKDWDINLDYDLIFDHNEKNSRAMNEDEELQIKYFPRYAHLHECFLYNMSNMLKANDNIVVEGVDYFSKSYEMYQQINYMARHPSREGEEFFDVVTCPCKNTSAVYAKQNEARCKQLRRGETCSRFLDQVRINKIAVGKEKYDLLRVGIASVQVNEKDIEDAWLGRPNISSERMEKLIKVVNLAAKEKVQLLVMPECYVPYCWVGDVVEAARKHNMAMVFGIEHIVQKKIAYNYLMTVLPVIVDGYNSCVVKMRLKNFYSPKEEEEIRSYHLEIPNVNKNLGADPKREYDLFSWNGVTFAPYNCFELTHINDRALFKSEIDLLIACEDNKDTEYFASIIDSLALDLHCYCVQVNASQYGDSKIAQPKGSYKKTILSIKGGENVFLIAGDVDIKALREFQVCSNSSDEFKPLPPGFIVKRVRWIVNSKSDNFFKGLKTKLNRR